MAPGVPGIATGVLVQLIALYPRAALNTPHVTGLLAGICTCAVNPAGTAGTVKDLLGSIYNAGVILMMIR
jgi:hypothetical protein